ncbi:MAG: HK97 family phage prohead protease [Gammaproteobacteria bacterium]
MIQTKDNPLHNCELKFSSDVGNFSGYASKFDGVDSYKDTIIKGAFTESLKKGSRMPVMLYGHNPDKVIGKYIEMSEDDNGLIVKGEFTPNHSDADNVYASMKHGAIDGLSIGFRIPPGGSDDKEDGGRYIKNVELMEVSIVAFPADLDARVQIVKSEIEEIESIRECELFLRESHKFTKSTAQLLIGKVKQIIRRDTDIKNGALVNKLEQQLHYETTTNQLIDFIKNM